MYGAEAVAKSGRSLLINTRGLAFALLEKVLVRSGVRGGKGVDTGSGSRRRAGVLRDEQVAAANPPAVGAAAHDGIAPNIHPVREGSLTDSIAIAGTSGAKVGGVVGAGGNTWISQGTNVFLAGGGTDNIIKDFRLLALGRALASNITGPFRHGDNLGNAGRQGDARGLDNK